MAAVRLPDGKELPIEPGERARDVAEKIGSVSPATPWSQS
jgi:hypothetical protein